MAGGIGAFSPSSGYGEITKEGLRNIFRDLQSGKLKLQDGDEKGYVVLLENDLVKLVIYNRDSENYN